MNIIYHCFGGAHSSVMAASIHLGHVTRPEGMKLAEVMALPYFDIQDDSELGSLRQVGIDNAGNSVYVLGRDRYSSTVKRLFESLCRHFGLPRSSFVTTDALAYVNVLMMIGGYLSRRLRLTRLGRLIVAYGTRIAAPALAGAVADTWRRAADLAKMDVRTRPVQFRRAYIYSSGGSALGALVAASMHTRIIEEERCPSQAQVAKVIKKVGQLPLQGEIVSFGLDTEGDMVLALGMGLAERILSRSLLSFLEISGVDPGRVTLVEVPRIGGAIGHFGSIVDNLSQSSGLAAWALHQSLRNQFIRLRDTVRRTRRPGAGLDHSDGTQS